jgi:hypothetical protein
MTIPTTTQSPLLSLSKGRRRFLKGIEVLFVEVLLRAREMGVLSLGTGTVALDGTKIHANASRHSALSYEHAGKLAAQLKAEVGELLAKAEAGDKADVPDGMSIPEELERREERLKKLAEARAKIEARANERFGREQAEYEATIAAREAKAKRQEAWRQAARAADGRSRAERSDQAGGSAGGSRQAANDARRQWLFQRRLGKTAWAARISTLARSDRSRYRLCHVANLFQPTRYRLTSHNQHCGAGSAKLQSDRLLAACVSLRSLYFVTSSIVTLTSACARSSSSLTPIDAVVEYDIIWFDFGEAMNPNTNIIDGLSVSCTA